jgi:hypothetical protein
MRAASRPPHEPSADHGANLVSSSAAFSGGNGCADTTRERPNDPPMLAQLVPSGRLVGVAGDDRIQA